MSQDLDADLWLAERAADARTQEGLDELSQHVSCGAELVLQSLQRPPVYRQIEPPHAERPVGPRNAGEHQAERVDRQDLDRFAGRFGIGAREPEPLSVVEVGTFLLRLVARL